MPQVRGKAPEDRDSHPVRQGITAVAVHEPAVPGVWQEDSEIELV